MKHAVEIILTLSTTFKDSADQQCVNAKTDFAFLDMTASKYTQHTIIFIKVVRLTYLSSANAALSPIAVFDLDR